MELWPELAAILWPVGRDEPWFNLDGRGAPVPTFSEM